MPKRSNDFQRLVLMIESVLQSEESSVLESQELTDRETGAKREVDIVVTSRHGNHDMVLSVECRGGENPRPVSVQWVEEMCCKHQALPTNKLVLVAKGGFTQEAKRKALARGITTLSLQEANETDWSALHNKWKEVRVIAWEFPELRNMHLFLKPPDEGDPVTPDLSLGEDEFSFPDGSRVGIRELYHQIIAEPTNFISIEEDVPPDQPRLIEIKIDLPEGTILVDQDDYTHFPYRVIFKAICVRHQSEHPLRRFFYGDASVAHGEIVRFRDHYEIVMGSMKESPESVHLTLRSLPTQPSHKA